MATENTQNTQKGRVLQGIVVASKMQDTCTVAVERYVKHPKYKKFMRLPPRGRRTPRRRHRRSANSDGLPLRPRASSLRRRGAPRGRRRRRRPLHGRTRRRPLDRSRCRRR